MTQAITDPRVWTAATAASSESWLMPLPARCLAILDAQARRLASDARPDTELRLDAAERALAGGNSAACCTPWNRAVGSSSSMRANPPRRCGRCTGSSARRSANRSSRTSKESCSTTCATPGPRSPRERDSPLPATRAASTPTTPSARRSPITSASCACAAQSGGVSQLVSGMTVHRILREHYPEVLAVLCRPFHVDRRGGARPGEPPTVCQPIVATDEHGLIFRYLRYWIEAGHVKVGQPLSAAQAARWTRSTRCWAARSCAWSSR